MNGSKLSVKVTNHLRHNYNAYVINVMVAGKSGIPDLIACINGKFFAFEVKGDGDRLSAIQSINLELIEESGGSACVVTCIEDVDLALNSENSSTLKPPSKIRPRREDTWRVEL